MEIIKAQLVMAFLIFNIITCNETFSISKKEKSFVTGIKTNSELNCDESPSYKNLEITTNFNENSDLSLHSF